MTVKKLPNILLIVFDTLSAKHMSLYGYHRKTTPFLEELAEECVIYNYCFSTSPWTSPSHASIFTGLYPPEHGCEAHNLFLNPKLNTLPQILKDMGYSTYGCSSNNLISEFYNFNLGYDNFKCIFFNPIIREHIKEVTNYIDKMKLLIDWSKTNWLDTTYYILSCLKITKFKEDWDTIKYSFPSSIETINYIYHKLKLHSSLNEKPFFIFANFMETHDAFNPPQMVQKTFDRGDTQLFKPIDRYILRFFADEDISQDEMEKIADLYDEEVLCTDMITRYIVTYLKHFNLYDNTMIIITSDHGECLGEHDLVEHSFCLYNENLHIPLIIKYPKGYFRNIIDLRLRQNTDIFHTICHLLDSPLPYQKELSLINSQGRKVALSFLDTEPTMKISLFLSHNLSFRPKKFMQPYVSIINKDFLKLSKRADGYKEAYNLKKDLYELNNILGDEKLKKTLMDLEKELERNLKRLNYRFPISIFRYEG